MQFDHFTIQLMTPQDAENYFELVENNRIRLEDFFSGTVAQTKTVADTYAFLCDLQRRTSAKTFYPYNILDQRTHKFIGYMHVMNFDWNVPKAEIGFFVDKEYTGKGIVTKAVQQLMDYYFNELGFNKLFLRTHENNLPSRKLAEKCGFEIEGHLRKDYKTTKGELVDMLYYGILKPH